MRQLFLLIRRKEIVLNILLKTLKKNQNFSKYGNPKINVR